MARDREGNIYITGSTRSPDFPTTEGAAQRTFDPGVCILPIGAPNVDSRIPCPDAFVVKLSADGKKLLYSTYLGGSGPDVATGIAVDGAGNAYVTGVTFSANFPVTPGAVKTSKPQLDGSDAFVAKLSPTGALLYSTYLGGQRGDEGAAIAVDGSGNAYIAGSTTSSDFPVTDNAFQTAYRGGNVTGVGDAFVAKLNHNGSALLYSTYLGGSGTDRAIAIAIDRGGNAYITGTTFSAHDFPTTPGAWQTSRRTDPASFGVSKGFASKLNSNGTALVYSTYLGGNNWHEPHAIAVDQEGATYIAGSASGDFPVTAGAAQTEGSNTDAFVLKLNPAGTAPVYSTLLGGYAYNSVWYISVDASGTAYVAGVTNSPDFPVTPGASRFCVPGPAFYGAYPMDAFVTVIRADGGAFLYSSYLGEFEEVYGDSGIAALVYPGTAHVAPSRSPALQCVSNGASLRNGAIAPGEIVSLFGPGIGPAVDMTGTKVLFDGAPVPLLYAAANQINAVVPLSVEGKSAVLVEIVKPGSSVGTLTVSVAPAAPGIFARSGAGGGFATVLNEDGSQNSTGNPSSRGSAVTFYATGAGLLDGPQPQLPVQVTIGGYLAELLYARATPGMVAGIVEIRARVPQAPIPSGAASLMIRIGDAVGPNSVFLNVE